MATNYAEHLSTKKTPQSEPVFGSNQIQNRAGGFVYEVSPWSQLDRFLILGSEKSFYAGERELTLDNAKSLQVCIKEDGLRVVKRILEISDSGRAIKNGPAIFALALTASLGDQSTKTAAYLAVNRVCRTGTHIFDFVKASKQMRGFGMGLRKAVARWLTEHKPSFLAYQVVKYQQRNGYSMRDLCRLAHPNTSKMKLIFGDDAARSIQNAKKNIDAILHYIVKGWDSVGELPHPEKDLQIIWAFERAKKATDKKEICNLIRAYKLPRECVPTQFLNEISVWDALLEDMPLTALVRNLGKMTSIGLIKPLSSGIGRVLAKLQDINYIKQSRLHPMTILVALKTYAQGHGDKGELTWNPVQQIVDGLDSAFYGAFANVESTGKRFLLAVDVSGSMCTSMATPSLSAREASAAMALILAATEPNHEIVAFSGNDFPGRQQGTMVRDGGEKIAPLPISPRMRLDSAMRACANTVPGSTDLALPMIYADREGREVDCFVTLSDMESYSGAIHPSRALKQYRQRSGINAKFVAMAMTATNYSVSDPQDALSLDICGFDSAVPQLISAFADL